MTSTSSRFVLAVGAVLCGSAGGWVWAPYSDIVTRTAVDRLQPRALAMITTGTGAGLIVLGGLAMLAVQGSWRLVWAGVATAATELNRKREVVRRLQIVLETHLSEVAARTIDVLYDLVSPGTLVPPTESLRHDG